MMERYETKHDLPMQAVVNLLWTTTGEHVESKGDKLDARFIATDTMVAVEELRDMVEDEHVWFVTNACGFVICHDGFIAGGAFERSLALNPTCAFEVTALGGAYNLMRLR